MTVRAEGDQLREAERALEQAEWDRARQHFEAVLATADSAPAYEGLGLALWFLGEVAEGIAARERAFDAYAAEGRCSDAARVAVWVSNQHEIAGRSSAARGWLARAERAVAEVEQLRRARLGRGPAGPDRIRGGRPDRVRPGGHGRSPGRRPTGTWRSSRSACSAGAR